MLYSPENNLFASLTENQSQYAYSYHEMHNNTDINSAGILQAEIKHICDSYHCGQL